MAPTISTTVSYKSEDLTRSRGVTIPSFVPQPRQPVHGLRQFPGKRVARVLQKRILHPRDGGRVAKPVDDLVPLRLSLLPERVGEAAALEQLVAVVVHEISQVPGGRGGAVFPPRRQKRRQIVDDAADAAQARVRVVRTGIGAEHEPPQSRQEA